MRNAATTARAAATIIAAIVVTIATTTPKARWIMWRCWTRRRQPVTADRAAGMPRQTIAAPRWRTSAPSRSWTNTAPHAMPIHLRAGRARRAACRDARARRRSARRAERRVDQRREVAHAEQQVAGRDEPRELVLDVIAPSVPCAITMPSSSKPSRACSGTADEQHGQGDLQEADRHRGQPVTVLVEHAADHRREQLACGTRSSAPDTRGSNRWDSRCRR